MGNGIGSGSGSGWRAAVALVLLGIAATASAQAAGSKNANGRGWVFGGTISGGSTSFSGIESFGLELGELVATDTGYGTTYSREARVARLPNPTPGTTTYGGPTMLRVPASQGEGGFSFHMGYAYSRRLALLLDVGVASGIEGTTLNQAVGSLVLRWSPTRRLWFQAGPANGQMSASYGGERTADVRSGVGAAAALGVVFLKRPTWELDVEGRFASVAYGGIRASRLQLAFGASRRRS